MLLARIPTWFFFACAAALSFIGLFMLVTAISTASLHFARCGPSSLPAPQQYCRGASRLLIAGNSVLLASTVFAVVAFWLRIKRCGAK
jgi:hypothetical protein